MAARFGCDGRRGNRAPTLCEESDARVASNLNLIRSTTGPAFLPPSEHAGGVGRLDTDVVDPIAERDRKRFHQARRLGAVAFGLARAGQRIIDANQPG